MEDFIQDSLQSSTEAHQQARECPRDILLVEDNMIIAIDAEAMLHELGVNSVRIACGVAEALRLLEQSPADFALLDVNLGRETSFEIAARLVASCTPFAFTSGYDDPTAFPAEYAQIPRLRKPYSAQSLRNLFATRE